jgi:hypothetical protein
LIPITWNGRLSDDNVSDGNQPPMTLDLSLSESAGRSLDRLVVRLLPL